MKIAVATDQGQVAGHFGHCEAFALYEVEDGKVVGEESIANPGHKPGFLPNFLAEKDITIMIVGGIGSGAVEIFTEKGIRVVAGASGESRTVVEQYLKGQLNSTGTICNH